VPVDTPGLSIRPIEDMSGEAHFNELLFDNAVVEDSAVVGDVGNGWAQILEQLDYERTGPERVLTTYPLFEELSRWAARSGDPSAVRSIGTLAAWIAALRSLSRAAAVSIDEGRFSAPTAAMVKDLGTHVEQAVAATAVSLTRSELDPTDAGERLMELMAQAQLYSPTFTLRGGTTEVLRTIIARRLLALPS
jgi:acyl-CoA dehydrogenase